MHWVQGPGQAPPGGQEVVRRAFAELSTHTGLQFVEDGGTDEPPAESRPLVQPARYGERWAPVPVDWATEATAPRLAGRVAGYAGPDVADDGGRLLVSGQVVLDRDDLAYPGDGGVKAFAYYAVLHELGHLVGLAHVDEPELLMYPQGHIASFAPGDLRWLAMAGSGPCSTRDRYVRTSRRRRRSPCTAASPTPGSGCARPARTGSAAAPRPSSGCPAWPAPRAAAPTR